MYCTKCGLDLRDTDIFCSRCGNQIAEHTLMREAPRRLMLDKRHKKVGGVCAGFARYFSVDLVLMRVLWLGISLGTGVGFLVYLAAWIIIPSDHGQESTALVTQIPQRM